MAALMLLAFMLAWMAYRAFGSITYVEVTGMIGVVRCTDMAFLEDVRLFFSAELLI